MDRGAFSDGAMSCRMASKTTWGEVLAGLQHFPKPNEGPHDLHAGLNRDWRVEGARQHDCPVLGEGDHGL